MQVLMQPLQGLHDTLQTRSAERIYQLRHTAQICHLKQVLDDAFGITDYQRGFEIQDIDAVGEWLMTYDETTAFEDNHLIAHDTPKDVLSDESTISTVTSAFIVLVPTDIYTDPDKMTQVRYMTNRYRLASRLPHYANKNDQ
ncbi:MAG: hypothetical protein NC404_00600 [Bacteroidales bacterium]|nr:hypothetical protein [Bacteroidales bacterium]